MKPVPQPLAKDEFHRLCAVFGLHEPQDLEAMEQLFAPLRARQMTHAEHRQWLKAHYEP
jgi:hypothetical protein